MKIEKPKSFSAPVAKFAAAVAVFALANTAIAADTAPDTDSRNPAADFAANIAADSTNFRADNFRTMRPPFSRGILNFSRPQASPANAGVSAESRLQKVGITYSDFILYRNFGVDADSEFPVSPVLNHTPFDLPADEFAAVEGGGLGGFFASPLGGFVVAAAVFAGAAAASDGDRNQDNRVPTRTQTPTPTPTDPPDPVDPPDTTPTDPTPISCPGNMVPNSANTGCECPTGMEEYPAGSNMCVATPDACPGEFVRANPLAACECPTGMEEYPADSNMCVPTPAACTDGKVRANPLADCECPDGQTLNSEGVCAVVLTALEMCQMDAGLQRRVFQEPAANAFTYDATASGISATPTPDLTRSLDEIVAELSTAIVAGGVSDQGTVWHGAVRWYNPDGNDGAGSWPSGQRGTDPDNLDLLVFSVPGVGGGVERRPMAGDIIQLGHSFAGASVFLDNIYRLYAKDDSGALFLAQNDRSPAVPRSSGASPDEREYSCAATFDPDSNTGGTFFLDDNWRRTTVFVESQDRQELPFNLREGLRGMLDETRAVQVQNFYFSPGDLELRDFQLEHRVNLFGGDSNSAAGDSESDELQNPFSAFVESGYAKQNGGQTKIFYHKLTAMRKLDSQTALYAQTSSGRIESEVYNDGDLRGFAAGIFADEVFAHNDSWHLRLESPFGDSRITKVRYAADVRFGAPRNYFRIGLRRDVETGDSAARLFWLTTFGR